MGAATAIAALAPALSQAAPKSEQPNILWIVTDDHRADAIAAFNRATRGTDESYLGYVSSPALDKLAAEGTLFTSAYCNSPASAPSRSSMHSGMYPHHRGVYGFEYYHDGRDYTPLMLPQLMKEAGYNDVGIGKLGVRMKKFVSEGKTANNQFYTTFLDTKYHQEKGFADWYPSKVWGKGENAGSIYNFFYPDGSKTSYYYAREAKPLTKEDNATRERFYKEQDILISYAGKGQEPKPKKMPNTILGGVSTNTTMGTTDGAITRDFLGYLDSQDKETYTALAGQKVAAPKGAQPQFLYLGHHFPHTPVLPSKSFRDKFSDKVYNTPLFDQAEYEKMPEQMQNWYSKTRVDRFKESEKQQMIRDYYAFTAMGDSLIGVEVDRFKRFCKDNNKEYLILVVCGDHSWHLGEQGVAAKFAAYESSSHTAVIAVSSNKKAVPAGKVVTDYMEYVDIVPTFISAAGMDISSKRFDYLDGYNLMDVISGKAQKRDYTIGEINAVCGPHGQIRCKDFMFGMRTRKDNGFFTKAPTEDANTEFAWAMNAPLEQVDAILYDLRVDPHERNNVALDPKYRKLAEFMRHKMGMIMLGDGRIEGDWKGKNDYRKSDFGVGSDDKKLDIPANIIPKVKR